MVFDTFHVERPLPGRCIYSREEYAFHFEPTDLVEVSALQRQGQISLVIDTLEIEVVLIDNRLMYITGFWPHTAWKKNPLPIIRPVTIGVRIVDFGRIVESGFPYRLTDSHDRGWTTTFDENTGWIRISSSEATEHDTMFCEFASNSVAAITHEKLTAFWLRPEIVGE